MKTVGQSEQSGSMAAAGGDVLSARLAELRSVPVTGLTAFEVRGHVAGMRTFLHEEVLRQAHTEELVLIPVLERFRDGLGAGLVAEHDTVRDATAGLDDFAERPMTGPHVRRVAGLLEGLTLLIDGHLAHEGDAVLEALQRLAADERSRLLTALGQPPLRVRTPRPPWLPELLPPVADGGPAGLLEPEAMIGASCPPGPLLVVRSAVAAASDGTDESTWRRSLLEHSRYRLQVPHAEECMRSAGLWPWNPALRPVDARCLGGSDS